MYDALGANRGEFRVGTLREPAVETTRSRQPWAVRQPVPGLEKFTWFAAGACRSVLAPLYHKYEWIGSSFASNTRGTCSSGRLITGITSAAGADGGCSHSAPGSPRQECTAGER